MKVRNVHERLLPVTPDVAGALLLDTLASEHDELWPHDRWPAMRFDGGLRIGARGGHGPIRYTVESLLPHRQVSFRFTAPPGFDGTHSFEIEAASGTTRIRHLLEIRAHGSARLAWPLIFRPLHDALIEDALDRAERRCGGDPIPARWSLRVRVLRRLLARRVRRRKTEV